MENEWRANFGFDSKQYFNGINGGFNSELYGDGVNLGVFSAMCGDGINGGVFTSQEGKGLNIGILLGLKEDNGINIGFFSDMSGNGVSIGGPYSVLEGNGVNISLISELQGRGVALGAATYVPSRKWSKGKVLPFVNVVTDLYDQNFIRRARNAKKSLNDVLTDEIPEIAGKSLSLTSYLGYKTQEDLRVLFARRMVEDAYRNRKNFF